MTSFLLVVAVVHQSEERLLARAVCERAGHRLIECGSIDQALGLLNNGLTPDLLLLGSFAASEETSLQLRELLKKAAADKICILAGPDSESQVELGIGRILTGQVSSSDLESAINQFQQERIARRGGDERRRSSAGAALAKLGIPDDMPGLPYVEELGGGQFFLAASPQMLEIHRQIKLLSATDANVLILGESGTGKEVIAQLIHRSSPRAREKFLKVNCAALPADLLESELFGHRQGAFTGAIKDHPGKFEQADGGTLLLDEIGEVGVQIQAKLLHVLQDGQFTRLGGQSCTKVDARVLAATNVQMEDALAEKTFRQDLYYRLSVFSIRIPPLRERREEIPYFMDETIRRTPAAMRNGSGEKLSSRLLDAALLYNWPGNLRELRNFITRTIILRDQDAALRELETKIETQRAMVRSAESATPVAGGSGIRSVVRDVKDRTEILLIQDALEAFRWNRRQAAQFLCISYRALLYKIQQHRLTPRVSRSVSESSIAK